MRKTDNGYDLHRGRIRVVEAVLSGTITETPVLEPTTLPYPYCGGVVKVGCREERLLHRCMACSGMVGGGALPEGNIDRV